MSSSLNPGHWLRRMFPTSRRLLLERSLRALTLLYYNNVLIIGAGYDPYRSIFPVAKEYVCLDIKPVDGVTDVVADALALPFVAAHFDCILASEVMEHLSDPFLFIREITRVLKLGGTVILTVPFMFHQHSDPYDYWRPTRRSLEELFSSFTEVDIWPQGNRMHVICDLLTTAFSPKPIFFPFRILNHLLVRLPGSMQCNGKGSTAPSGFLLVARK